jgi:hypothetical protein
MPCCGQARVQAQGAISHQRASVAQRPAPQPGVGQTVYFRYFGQTGLTVTGPASARVYQFAANRSPVPVDARDAASFARVSNLRMVR